ncbi:alpha/beta hydrolase [Nocardioides pocheonensis]|jgi:alpha-beta hydrolase superfamily lysophospholipase|uniref:Alpha/beta hydrolase n=1 Tax=Nocardioides pocheonensis TaxID=661485 RepID=A0A3N0GPZ4_9ACTN|nr:alpha/beta hydrolase [Nocardioides pocheonensis]RNM14286.1 alpha/beta hydrolase [Nocardioides pocheonensis]
MAPTSTEETSSREDRPDVLGAPYVARTLRLAADDEGECVATLVHRPADRPTGRAVLHVHGFADYFFQVAAADFWCERGYDFYALDLRKYGRSLLAHQTPNFVTDLSAYYEELDLALEVVSREHEHVVLSAHSTGGLTVPLWASDRGLEVAGMVLNSPWLDMHGDAITRYLAMPVLHRVGARRSRLMVPRKVSGIYARSLHHEHEGEWEFDLAWKPLESWPVYAGWIRAIRTGQARVAAGIDVRAPVLVLASTRSGHPSSIEDPDVSSTDIVLDVEQIRRRSTLLGRHVTLAQVEGAIHDVTLSRPEVRKVVFDEIARFLTAYVEG